MGRPQEALHINNGINVIAHSKNMEQSLWETAAAPKQGRTVPSLNYSPCIESNIFFYAPLGSTVVSKTYSLETA